MIHLQQNIVKTLKKCCPPILTDFLKKLFKKSKPNTNFLGHYQDWNDALHDSEGYDSPVILEKTLVATKKVKNGEAVFERDSVLFDKPDYPFFLIACLLWIAHHKNGVLRVMDFGGALGSSYFQCRKFLNTLKKVRWAVVEQKRHVEYGRKFLQDDVLRFHYSIEECLACENPDVVVLSGVLHVMEKPYELVRQVLGVAVENFVVDRQPLREKNVDRLCVMRVDPKIYPASYPCWLLSETRFRNYWSAKCVMIAEDEAEPLFVDDEKIPRRRFFYSKCSI